ncbi:MAG: hypothetical protein ACI8RT_000925, partial [Candidatus Azotimanducaceae bacterium]
SNKMSALAAKHFAKTAKLRKSARKCTGTYSTV